MKIYKIYCETIGYDYNLDETTYLESPVKYVSSMEKVNEFLKGIELKNQLCEKCCNCPVWKTTKRKYDSDPSIITDYCSNSDIGFSENDIVCLNDNSFLEDLTEYKYEEIEVE